MTHYTQDEQKKKFIPEAEERADRLLAWVADGEDVRDKLISLYVDRALLSDFSLKMLRAKRDVAAPPASQFWDDVWPKVLADSRGGHVTPKSKLLYTAKILKNNGEFSQKAIDQMVAQLPGRSVLLNYRNGVCWGGVVSARQSGDFVVCEFTSSADVLGMFAGPGYAVKSCHAEGDDVVIDDIDVLCLGIFSTHKDNVPPTCLAGEGS